MQRKFQASFDDFRVDSDRGLCHVDKELPLPPKELAVLTLLLQRAGALVTKEDIIAFAWNGTVVSDESITRCISVIKSRLREASPGAETVIKTEYGRGYRFVGNVSRSESYLSEESFHALIDASPDFICIKDGQGRWLAANHAGLQLYQLLDKDWRGKTDLELMELSSPHYRESFKACMIADEVAWNARSPTYSTESVRFPNGKAHYFEFIKSPIFAKDGSRKSLVILGREITKLIESLQQNRLSAHMLASDRDALMICDADLKIAAINRAFTEMSGYEAAEVIGKTPRLLSSGKHDSGFYEAMWHALLKEGAWRGEVWNKRKNGELHLRWMSISAVQDQAGKLSHYIATYTDMSGQREAQRQLELMAYHDPLTGLCNRLLLRDRFELAVASAHRSQRMIALLFLDLDLFKQVNDTLGHAVGDQVLCEVADRLSACVRESDTVCRLGGDEFAVLLTDLQEVDTAAIVAQKILEQFAKPIYLNSQSIQISFSIGIAMYPDDAGDLESMMRLADAAMYYAKDCGKNTYRFYTAQMNVSALEKLHLRKNLMRALQQNEFSLHYQPRFDLASGRPVALETLVRWQNAEFGDIPPIRFLPMVEDHGLMIQLGDWILREACRQAALWAVNRLPALLITVKVSELQFRRGNLVERVAAVLRDTGLPAAQLELECSEKILVQEIEQVIVTLQELRHLGVRLAIDHYGISYSRLSDLKRLPIERIKLDQSFVRNLCVDQEDAALTRSVIQLGHNLQLRTVADGVETAAQLQYLKTEGCDEAQGYYFSHPLPVADATRFLENLPQSY